MTSWLAKKVPIETENYNSLGGNIIINYSCECMCYIQWNKVLETKSYFEHFKILLKMCAMILTERAIKNEPRETHSLVPKGQIIKLK